MEKIGLISSLDDGLLLEFKGAEMHKSSPTAALADNGRNIIIQTLKGIKSSADVGLILQAERNLIENERGFYSNSPIMATSLNNSLNELNGAETTYAKVYDPASYKTVNESYLSHTSRKGALPKDETRQFFSKQYARLMNMNKARLSDGEKEVIKARQSNLRIGETAYIALQKQALGIAPTQSKDKEDGMEL